MYIRGQFALIGKVGRKALRLYDEEGLLVPVAVNGENGYHYYDRSHRCQRLKRSPPESHEAPTKPQSFLQK